VGPEGVTFAAFTQAGACAVELLDERGEPLALIELEPHGDGYFQSLLPQAKNQMLYWLVIEGKRLPDPYARFLPRGVHGPAQIVDSAYAFTHLPPLRKPSEHVIYELHVGTFTEEGTFDAARGTLPALVELGITTIELMPIAAFAGGRGWGYDGVALFAPHAAYGTPDQLRELIDAAHGHGLSVLLDVVYNHFGPDGNYLAAFSPSYFSDEHHNAWGKALNFAEPALRGLVLENARYWLREFGFDGLRLDATHAIVDDSARHILSELADVAHELEPKQILIAEDERNLAQLVTGHGLDALWADDFHHQLRVTLTGERSGYYAAYQASTRALAEVINQGWLYRGQLDPLTQRPRGSSCESLSAAQLVYCVQNHDQIGNRAFGDRLQERAGLAAFRAASLLLLFLPMTPLLFMGQEWGAATPFLYFTDHEAELGQRVSAGRRLEFARFEEFSEELLREKIPDPQAVATFRASKLRWSERELPEHAVTLELYRAALRLRRTDPVLRHAERAQLRAEAVDDVLLVHRSHANERRTLVVNFGTNEVQLSSLSQHLRLYKARVLLQSLSAPNASLPPKSAVVLAGEGRST
jgi:maltooligosyltrehalose trehalohydrolase